MADDRRSNKSGQGGSGDSDSRVGTRPVGRVDSADPVFETGKSAGRGQPEPQRTGRQSGKPASQSSDNVMAGAAPRQTTSRPTAPTPPKNVSSSMDASRRPSPSTVTGFQRSAPSGQSGSSTSYRVSSNSRESSGSMTAPDPSRSSSNITSRNYNDQFGRDDKLEGTILSDDFMVVKMVGFGGYGRVYQAEQLSVGKRSVAIKVLHAMHRDKPATINAFKREVSYLSMLRASCFPRVIRTGLTPDGLPYFAMEFITGKALDSILKSNGALDINRSIFIMDRVCEGIVEMHRKDIVHRDIKPGNVIIEEGPAKAWSVWMLDLGCAKPAYEPDTALGREDTFSFGSPPYMAPETVISGVTNEQTDIYSLGCMAYELLTGVRAIHLKDTSADSYFAYLRNTEKPVPTYRVGTIVPELPEVLEQVIHRALIRDLSVRYTSVMEFRNALVSAATPYMDRLSSMAIDLNSSSNVSGFSRKDMTNTGKKSGLAGRLLLHFKKG